MEGDICCGSAAEEGSDSSGEEGEEDEEESREGEGDAGEVVWDVEGELGAVDVAEIGSAQHQTTADGQRQSFWPSISTLKNEAKNAPQPDGVDGFHARGSGEARAGWAAHGMELRVVTTCARDAEAVDVGAQASDDGGQDVAALGVWRWQKSRPRNAAASKRTALASCLLRLPRLGLPPRP